MMNGYFCGEYTAYTQGKIGNVRNNNSDNKLVIGVYILFLLILLAA